MGRKRISLNENDMRRFISYSVARLLKEAYGRPIFDRHGEYDGSEYSRYGSDSTEVEFDPFENDDMMAVFEKVLESGKYQGLTKEMFDDYESGEYGRIWPLRVRVEYRVNKGMRGNGYDTPNDPDEIKVTGWELVSAPNIKDQTIRDFLTEVINTYFKEGHYDAENELSDIAGLNEGYDGRVVHFGSKESEEAADRVKNPYKKEDGSFYTWDEYCEMKRKEREDRKEKDKLHTLNYPDEKKDREKNKGIMTHIPGEKEDDEKIRITEQDIAKIVKKTVNEISKGLLDRAREAAHKDMMRNFGDSKTRQKRERQWKKFGDEYRRMDREEKDSICPQVDERDLVNMPEDTYVIMNGDGRDAVNANFRTSYSGRAGTKEQCEEYVNRFYDKGANWEYLPEIVPLKDYLKSRHRQ